MKHAALRRFVGSFRELEKFLDAVGVSEAGRVVAGELAEIERYVDELEAAAGGNWNRHLEVVEQLDEARAKIAALDDELARQDLLVDALEDEKKKRLALEEQLLAFFESDDRASALATRPLAAMGLEETMRIVEAATKRNAIVDALRAMVHDLRRCRTRVHGAADQSVTDEQPTAAAGSGAGGPLRARASSGFARRGPKVRQVSVSEGMAESGEAPSSGTTLPPRGDDDTAPAGVTDPEGPSGPKGTVRDG